MSLNCFVHLLTTGLAFPNQSFRFLLDGERKHWAAKMEVVKRTIEFAMNY